MNTYTPSKDHVTTALLLAAGLGSRLYPLTKTQPKCMTIVNGRSILERMVSSLIDHNFKRLVIVTGHLDKCIQKFLGDRISSMKIEYIFSPLYKTTNNIYSLWMARKAINEPFLLLESDLIYDGSLLDEMLSPDRIAVAREKSWMNGTCVTMNKQKMVKQFILEKSELLNQDIFKTVNIYSFSMKSWVKIKNRLDKKISDGMVNEYYEVVFADLVAEGFLDIKAVMFDYNPWYEIDTMEDLNEAKILFPS